MEKNRPMTRQNGYQQNNFRRPESMYLTKGNVPLDDERLRFKIDTAMMRNFIQEKMNVIASVKGIEPVTIELGTLNPGTSFYPILLFTSTDILEDRIASAEDEEVDDIIDEYYMPKDEDGEKNGYRPCRMNPYYFQLLKMYMYDSNWKHEIGKSSKMKEYGIRDIRVVKELKAIHRPKIARQNGVDCVVVLLDPLEIFQDMLTFKDPEENRDENGFRKSPKKEFHVFPTYIAKTKDGEFKYWLDRDLDKKKKSKKEESICDSINKKMNFGR